MLPLLVLLLLSAAASGAPSSDAEVAVPAAPGAWEPLIERFTDLPSMPAMPAAPRESEVSETTTKPGCAPCKPDRCPRSASECTAGLSADPCGCCPGGVCGLAEGSRCYNASHAHDPMDPLSVCGDSMDCIARSDLREKDTPEALCVCRDRGQVCGSDNTTYSSSCQMRLKQNEPGQPRVWLKHRGPCRAAPWIVTPPAPVSYVLGSPVSLECEVKGYPAPAASWERINEDGIATALPSDDASLVVMLRGGPEPFMASSWLQIMALREDDVGAYICVATNSEGVARVATEVTVMPAVPSPAV